jgi:hypothetical protein
MAEMGSIPRDPVKESVALELDMINILYVVLLCFTSLAEVSISIRLVQILAMRSNNRK